MSESADSGIVSATTSISDLSLREDENPVKKVLVRSTRKQEYVAASLERSLVYAKFSVFVQKQQSRCQSSIKRLLGDLRPSQVMPRSFRNSRRKRYLRISHLQMLENLSISTRSRWGRKICPVFDFKGKNFKETNPNDIFSRQEKLLHESSLHKRRVIGAPIIKPSQKSKMKSEMNPV